MIIYFIKSASCLALLLLFYHFILEKEKMHNFNRFYLLGSVLFSFLAPLYIIYLEVTPIAMEVPISEPSFNNYDITTPETIVESTVNKTIDYTSILIGLYALISCIFIIRFGRNLYKIIQKIKNNPKVDYQNAILVLVDDNILPHTFWKSIFINKKAYENKKIEAELFTHELTHVTQKHTLDVLVIEFLQAIFWINPLFIFLKKAIQLNHEFLADENVIKQHKNTLHYQHLLVNKAAWNNEYYLASNLNYLLTKKRLKMMTTQSSQTNIWIKKLSVIPLLAGFIFLFAERVEAQESIEIVDEKSTSIPIETNLDKKKYTDQQLYKEYYYKSLKIVKKDKNGKNISKTYNELTTEEKERLIPPPPLKSKKRVPTKKQFDDLKDKSKYAVWIDGKLVENEVLEKYQNSDFSGYFVSFVYKNARSKSFPQNYQASLYTNNYFENQNKDRIKKYQEYLNKRFSIIVDKDQIDKKPTKNSQTLFNKEKYKDYKYFVDGKLTDASKIIEIETYKIKSTTIDSNTKTIYIVLKK